MIGPGVFVWLAIAAGSQIPPPLPAEADASDLRAELRSLLERESNRLEALAESLRGRGQADQAEAVARRIEPVPPPDGPTRFVPLADVVPAADRDAMPTDPAGPIRAESARSAFELASRAHEAGRYALADACLRVVVDRQPDHAEARRLLGFVPNDGGWATPFAVSQLRAGRVSHPTFGWVPADWVERLDRGELPAPSSAPGPTAWLPAEMADALRRDWNPPWRISTEHFQIQTNVSMAEAIAFARRLEDFHALFFSLMADLLGPNLPLARRFRDPGSTAEAAKVRHRVNYFAEKEEYVNKLGAVLGPDVDQSLGIYLSPDVARKGRFDPASFFYKSEDGDIETAATLYHEVSHQLLFENRGSRYNYQAGHYWTFEGLGTYFETVAPRPDGSIQVGGRIGARVAAARNWIVRDERMVPLARLVAMDKVRFDGNRGDDVYLNYAEAMAFTLYLMQADSARYREPFLGYVESVFRGSPGRPLDDRLGVSYPDLEGGLIDYLRDAGPTAAADPGR